MKYKLILALILTAFTAAIQANDEEDWGDDWGDEEMTETAQQSSQYQLNGFIEAGYGDFTSHHPLLTKSTLAEARSRIALKYSQENWTLAAKAELIYDDLPQKWQWHNRELSLSTSLTNNLDIKLGRQILTWGTGDYLFLNDLFAKDWQSFFSGRDDQYLKAPSDSVKLSYYLKDIAIDIAWTPKFTSDTFLTGQRFSFYSPIAQTHIAPAEQFQVINQQNDQISTRVSTTYNGIEYALYGYKGYWTTPQGFTPQGQGYFPKLTSIGASIRMPLGNGLLNSEYASYNADKNDPMQNNGQHRFLVGYEQEIAKNLTASGQIYLEKTKAYDTFKSQSTNPNEVVDQNRTLITLRLRYATMAQKLTYNLFAFYSPSDQDSYLRPSINYRHNDQWHFAIGANLFQGKHHYSFFGQHQDNSNGWMRIKWSW